MFACAMLALCESGRVLRCTQDRLMLRVPICYKVTA
jgi:hypothetical protein